MKRIKINEHRDLPLMIHIWKWKVATTASLYLKFFKGLSPNTAYYRLNRLRNHKFLQVRTDVHGQKPVWMLDKKGFQCVKDILPELKENGFRSEKIIHDLLCSSLHQGDFLMDKPDHVELVSEQQLRRYYLEFLPTWVPDPSQHRPDGYFRFKDGSKGTTVAIELERSRKTTDRLESLASHYAQFMEDFEVLWVVESKRLGERIHLALEKAHANIEKHHVTLLKSFLKHGWQTEFLNGEFKGKTIRDYICVKARTNPQQTPNRDYCKIILDHSLRYQNDLGIPNSGKNEKLVTI